MSLIDNVDNTSELMCHLHISPATCTSNTQSTGIPAPADISAITEGCVALRVRRTLPQPQSPLLRLPTELRLQICSYMNLSPALPRWEWGGAFFSCRQLHKDMLDQLPPGKGLTEHFLKIMIKRPSFESDRLCKLRRGPIHPLFSWIRSVTAYVPVWGGYIDAVYGLYPLYLDKLQILLTDDQNTNQPSNSFRGSGRTIDMPYGDLKTLSPPGLLISCRGITVNCKKITLTLDKLANADGGRTKETSYNLIIPDTAIVYLFTVVQDEEERQVERSYTFSKRFKLPNDDVEMR